MHYELHVQGNPTARFNTEHDVIEAAAKAARTNRNAQILVIDLATGQPASLSDRRVSHEEYMRRLSL